MCERAYTTYKSGQLYSQYLNKGPQKLQLFRPNYNLSPTQDALALRMVDRERQFDEMHWQLIPRWEPDFTTKFSTINAKCETVFEGRMTRDLIVRQRCVVPLSGFFEWKKEGGVKRPFKIDLQDKSIMSVAGIWDTWSPGTPNERRSFSILTTTANEFMSRISDRMPLILGADDLDAWLDPEIQDPEVLKKLMKPCPGSWLEASEISALVNSPKNNSPEILDAADPALPASEVNRYRTYNPFEATRGSRKVWFPWEPSRRAFN